MDNKDRKYGLWSEDDMHRAIAAVQNGDMGLNAACRTYGVSKPTLKRHMEGTNTYATDEKKFLGRPQELPAEIEQQIVKHVLDLECMFFGLSRDDLKSLAFQVAEANNINHRFNKSKKMAGDKWYYSFLRRNPCLSLRKPEPTSMARATGFSKERIEEFYQKLTAIVDDNHFEAADIYNVDETALSTVQRPRKVVGLKGKHQIGGMTSGERGVLTTGIFCMSASGVYVPPMLVFKGHRFKPEWKFGAPPGTNFAISDNGWSNKDIFLEWLGHFLKFVKPTNEKKVLLILDGHASHTKSLDVISFAKTNGIIMLSLPSHTSHKLQPLDVSFFAPLKSNFNSATEKYIRTNQTKVTTSHISLLLGESYPKTASIATAMNGFKACGIWPVDKDRFLESDFATKHVPSTSRDAPSTSKDMTPTSRDAPSSSRDTPSTSRESDFATKHVPLTSRDAPSTSKDMTPTSRDAPSSSRDTPSTSRDATSTSKDTPPTFRDIRQYPLSSRDKPSTSRDATSTLKDTPSTSRDAPSSSRDASTTSKDRPSTSQSVITPIEEISPLPDITKFAKRRRVETSSVIVLTSTPYKNSLIEAEAKKKEKIERKATKDKTKNVKRNLGFAHSSKEVTKKTLQEKPDAAQKKMKIKQEETLDSWYCKICGENKKINMIQCLKCRGWDHVVCAGVKPTRKQYFCFECI